MKFLENLNKKMKFYASEEKRKKKMQIICALTDYYRDLATIRGIVELFPATKALEAFNRYVQTDEDLNRVYKNLKKYKKRMAV